MVRLFPANLLATMEGEVGQRISRLTVQYRQELLDDEQCGRFLRFYLLFTHWPSMVVPEGAELNPTDVFYNRYRWFLSLTRLYHAKHGYDAGLEQQAFKLLEEVGAEVDWSAIEEIEARVTEDVACRDM
jgi:hypothetical protein